jgi:hypothetical protein
MVAFPPNFTAAGRRKYLFSFPCIVVKMVVVDFCRSTHALFLQHLQTTNLDVSSLMAHLSDFVSEHH